MFLLTGVSLCCCICIFFFCCCCGCFFFCIFANKSNAGEIWNFFFVTEGVADGIYRTDDALITSPPLMHIQNYVRLSICVHVCGLKNTLMPHMFRNISHILVHYVSVVVRISIDFIEHNNTAYRFALLSHDSFKSLGG